MEIVYTTMCFDMSTLCIVKDISVQIKHTRYNLVVRYYALSMFCCFCMLPDTGIYVERCLVVSHGEVQYPSDVNAPFPLT